MAKNAEGLTKNIASSRNWFRSEFLPEDVQLQRHTFIHASTTQYYDGIKILYVEEGVGRLLVNGTSYPLQPGGCYLLYCYHFHKIIPAPGKTLHLSSCLISYNTFLFASIVPGYHLSGIERTMNPVCVSFPPESQPRIRYILSALEEKPNPDARSPGYALIFELLGRLCREYSKV